MKVGVITFSSSKDNYGQILQCYALQKFLEKEGHNPFLIRYTSRPQVDPTGFKPKSLVKYLFHFSHYVKWYYAKRKTEQDRTRYQKSVNFAHRDFAGFLKQHVQQTEVYSADEIEANPPFADAYICGSDQIWGGDRAYYLSFAPDEAIKIAYAPSLGGLNQFAPAYEATMKKLLCRLNRIGMREQSGVDIINRMGFEAEKVVDPTLLLTADDYEKIAVPPTRSGRYAFVYLLGNPIDTSAKKIQHFVRHNGLDMVYVVSQGRNDSLPKEDLTIGEWLGHIANAEVVITNSFHCVVFSLIFQRKFISIPLSRGFERMNTRIEELLGDCGMMDNIQSTDFSIQESDFSQFDALVEKERHHTQSFLSILNRQ